MLGNSERLVKLIQPSGPMSRNWTSCLSYYDTGRRSFLDEKCEGFARANVSVAGRVLAAGAPKAQSSKQASRSRRLYVRPKSLTVSLLRK
jgi:hypothetical protein